MNANGDGFTKNVRFVVDTYTTMLALNSPLTGSLASVDDQISINGRTEADNCASIGFTDLDVKAWYHLDVDYAIENGIFNGVTQTELHRTTTSHVQCLLLLSIVPHFICISRIIFALW